MKGNVYNLGSRGFHKKGISGKISKVAHPYADMYTAVWDDYEDDNLSVPHNQMGLFEDLEVLPQFERLTEDLI